MGYRNLLVENALPTNVREHSDATVVCNGKFYAAESDTWVEKTIGTPPSEFPVGFVVAIFGDGDPAVLLGYGVWEAIKKEEAGSGVIYYWVRTK